MRALLAILILLLPLPARAAEPLGRLFFTPEQRAQLDTLRTKKVAASQVKDEPVPENITYSGIVQRSDGKSTVWVNNKALSEHDVRETGSLVGRIERDGRILVQPFQGSKAPAMRLKVGQSAELLSGQINERAGSANAETAPKNTAKPAAAPGGAKAATAPAPGPGAAISVEEAAKITPVDAADAAKLKALVDAAR